MPYLSFDLDALETIPDVAHAAGVNAPEIAYGLLRLWRHAWRAKTEHVTEGHLSGFFPGDPHRIRSTLETFGFIESTKAGIRVRGADRYLRINAARSEGGKKASGNLKRGTLVPAPQTERAGGQPGVLPGSSSAQAGNQPGTTPGSPPALTSSSEQRAANSEHPKEEPPPPPKVPLPRMPADPLEDVFSFYAFVQNQRHEAGLMVEKPPSHMKLSQWWSEAVGALNGDPKPLIPAFRRFTKNEFWRDKDPPFPFHAFIANWRDYVR